MIVASARLTDVIREIANADVQLVHATVGESEDVWIVNILRLVDCIDTSRTIGTHWGPGTPRPDKPDEYRSIDGLVLDRSRMDDAAFFRPKTWPVAAILSSDMKAELTSFDLSGIRFQTITAL